MQEKFHPLCYRIENKRLQVLLVVSVFDNLSLIKFTAERVHVAVHIGGVALILHSHQLVRDFAYLSSIAIKIISNCQ